MPLLRATITIPYFTGAPDDVATNTLYFQTPEGTTIAQSVIDAGVRMNSFFSSFDAYYSNMTVSPATVKYYDMAQPEPRVPVGSSTIVIDGNPAAQNLPEEVAVCVSFQAPRVSGLTQARRRGRIFIGPLNFSAITSVTGDAFVQVNPTFRTTLATAAAAMANTTTNLATWVVWSPTDGEAHPVSNGWIDVNPDTQRRRGGNVAGRTLWTAP